MNTRYAELLIPLILCGTVVLDALTPLGFAVWTGHLFAVLLTLWIERRNAHYLVAAVASVLLTLGFFLSPPGLRMDVAVFNRFVGFGLYWTAAWVVALVKRARLDDATRRLGAIVESSSDAILSLTLDGVLTSWNAGAEQVFGYSASEMIGRSVRILTPDDFPDEQARMETALLGVDEVHTYDAVRKTKAGRLIDVSITLSPLKDAAGRVLGMSKIIRDISDRKRGETLLKQAHEALEARVQERTFELSNANHLLRELSWRLMQVQEEERSRLARDLHDEVGQLLTALKIDLQEVQRGEAGMPRSGSIRESLELVDRLLSQVRSMALDLRPSILDDLGLGPALRWYANRQADRNGWVLSLSIEGMTKRVPAPIEIACFRVVQEALTNVAKYAKARAVDITLRQQDNEVLLFIQDDGVGFDVMVARRRAKGAQTVGLLGMEERVRLADGTLEILSKPGQGTRLHLSFPLAASDQFIQSGTVGVMAP